MPRTAGLSRTARQAIGYQEVLAYLDGSGAVARRRVRRGRAPHQALRPSPGAVVPAGPPHHLGRGRGESLRCAARPAGIVEPMSTIRLSKLHATGNDFLVHAGDLAECDIAGAARLCDRHRGIGADGLIAAPTGRRRRRLHDGPLQRRRRPRRDERERHALPRVGGRARRPRRRQATRRRHRRRPPRGRRRVSTPSGDVVAATVDMGPVTFDPPSIPLDRAERVRPRSHVSRRHVPRATPPAWGTHTSCCSSTIPRAPGSPRTARTSSTTSASRTARTWSS